MRVTHEYLRNDRDAMLLNSDQHLDQIAKQLAEALSDACETGCDGSTDFADAIGLPFLEGEAIAQLAEKSAPLISSLEVMAPVAVPIAPIPTTPAGDISQPGNRTEASPCQEPPSLPYQAERAFDETDIASASHSQLPPLPIVTLEIPPCVETDDTMPAKDDFSEVPSLLEPPSPAHQAERAPDEAEIASVSHSQPPPLPMITLACSAGVEVDDETREEGDFSEVPTLLEPHRADLHERNRRQESEITDSQMIDRLIRFHNRKRPEKMLRIPLTAAMVIAVTVAGIAGLIAFRANNLNTKPGVPETVQPVRVGNESLALTLRDRDH